MKQAKIFFLIAAIFVAGSVFAEVASPVFKDKMNVAVKGYDVVAYFSQKKPVAGKSEFEHQWNGATWRFASAENRDLFAKEPEKYAPQFGGYCAYGVAEGHLAPIDPIAFNIISGKLYLNYNLEVKDMWVKDIPGYIHKATQQWPELIGTKK